MLHYWAPNLRRPQLSPCAAAPRVSMECSRLQMEVECSRMEIECSGMPVKCSRIEVECSSMEVECSEMLVECSRIDVIHQVPAIVAGQNHIYVSVASDANCTPRQSAITSMRYGLKCAIWAHWLKHELEEERCADRHRLFSGEVSIMYVHVHTHDCTLSHTHSRLTLSHPTLTLSQPFPPSPTCTHNSDS